MTDETPEPRPPGDREMPLVEHLEELRSRIIRMVIALGAAFFACYSQSDKLVAFFVKPLKAALPPGGTLQFTKITEPFMVHLKVSLVAALVVAFPYVCWQVWAFVSPGLYRKEKRLALPFVTAASLAFAAGVAFCFTVAFPFGFRFLVQGYATDDIVAIPKLEEYFTQATTMLVAFGLVFELPVVSFVLARLGVITARGMLGGFRVAVLLIAIVAAVLSPPDVISMSILGVPMLLLYLGSAGLVALVEQDRPPDGDT